MTRVQSATMRLGRAAMAAMLVAALALVGACGGGDDDGAADRIEIAVQPASAEVVAGTSVDFRVSATGVDPSDLSYQWQRSTDDGARWSDIVGATASTLRLPAAELSDDQSLYRVVVSGAGGASGISEPATLGVASQVRPAGVSVQPQDQRLAEGEEAQLAVTATGTALRYQWQVDAGGDDWTDLPGSTQSTLNLGPVALDDSGKRYRALLANDAGIVATEAAALEVGAAESTAAVAGAPAISRQPAATTVVAPQVATFSVVASGSPAPTYQWQLSTDGGATYGNIALANGASYTTPATRTSDTGRRYRVRVSNANGSVTSAAAVLTVAAVAQAPGITSQPANKTVTAPTGVSFSVSATGAPSPSFQWQVSTDGGATYTAIAGATRSSYSLTTTTTADSGKRFRVRLANSAGTVFSRAAVLTVQPSPSLVYTANAGSNLITGYAVRRSTGTFAATPGSPYAGPQSASPLLVLHPNGRFLYAVEVNEPRTWVYAVDPATGRLTLTAGSPYTTLPIALAAPVADPSGRFLNFNAGFQLASYAINPTTGGLTATGSLVFSQGSPSLEFSKDSKFIFVQDGNAQLRVLQTNPLALLTDTSTIVPIVSGTRFYARGKYLLAQRPGAGLTSFTIGATGALTPVQSLAGFGPNIVAHRNGQCFFMSGSANGNAPSQSVTFTPVALNPATGALTAKTQVRIPVPSTVTVSAYPLLANPGGTFGYLSRLDGFLLGNITPVALNGTACSITAGAPFDAGVLQQNVRFDASGSLLVNFLTAVPSLYLSKIDPVTRVPAQVAGSPITTSGATRQVVVR